MAIGDVKVLGGRPIPYVNRVQIALNLKSGDYEFLEEVFSSKSEMLLIPGDIHESLIIVQYIDDVWTSDPSIMPSDPSDAAVARLWAAYIDHKLFPSLREIQNAVDEEAKKATIERVKEMMELIEDAFIECSKGKDFFGGDNIGYLDIAFGSFLGWLRASEELSNIKLLDEVKTPGLVRWADKFSSHEAVKGVIPETEKLVELAKMTIARAKAQSQN